MTVVEVIILLPAIIALSLCFTRGVQKVFFDVYLPALFLLPQGYLLYINYFPELSFGQAVMLVIALFIPFTRWKAYRFTFVDVLMVLMAFWAFTSEAVNSHFRMGLQSLFGTLTVACIPYFVAKGMIESGENRLRFAKRIAFLCFLNILISHYEMLFNENFHHRLLDSFFPGQWEGSVGRRLGLQRLKGPYSSPIFTGLVTAVAFRLSRWMEWSNLWERHFRKIPRLGMSKGRVMSWTLLYGVFMSLSRGPWIGALVGAWTTAIGRARNKRLSLALRIALVVGFTIALAIVLKISLKRANESYMISTIAYRLDTLARYMPYFIEAKWIGWGTLNQPVVFGLHSIDNFYLFICIQRGIGGLLIFLSILFWSSFRLLRRGMKKPDPERRGGKLAFTLLGIQVMFLFTLATVWMDTMVTSLLFMIVGWSEGYLCQHQEETAVPQKRSKQPRLANSPTMAAA